MSGITLRRKYTPGGVRHSPPPAPHTPCHPERSGSFANAKLLRSRRTPTPHAQSPSWRGALTALSSPRGEFRESTFLDFEWVGVLRLRSGRQRRERESTNSSLYPRYGYLRSGGTPDNSPPVYWRVKAVSPMRSAVGTAELRASGQMSAVPPGLALISHPYPPLKWRAIVGRPFEGLPPHSSRSPR